MRDMIMRQLLSIFIFLAIAGCKQQNTPVKQLLPDGNTNEHTIEIGNLRPLNDTAHIRQLVGQGNLIFAKFPDSALNLYKEALDISYANNHNEGIAVALISMSTCLFAEKKSYKQAEMLIRAALPYCYLANNRNHKLLPNAFNMLGNIYFEKGLYDSASYFFHKTLDIVKNQQAVIDTTSLIAAYTNIGAILGNLRHNDEVLPYLQRAVRWATYAKDTWQIARINQNIGTYYEKMKDGDSALTYYNKALRLYQSKEGHKAKMGIQEVYVYMAHLWSLTSTPEKAKIYLDSAVLAYKESLENNWPLLTSMGFRYYTQGQFLKAISYYKKSLEICDEQNIAEGKLNNYAALAIMYDTIGDGHQAYMYQSLYSDLKDSLQSAERMKAVNDFEVKYKIAEKDRQLAIKDKNILIAAAANKRKTAAIWITSLCILLLASIIISLRYRMIFKLRSLNQQRELDMLKAIMEGEEAERQRVGQELHDGVSGLLSAIKMNLVTLRLNRKDIAEENHFVTTIELADEAADELRKTAHNLVPASLSKNGISMAVSNFCERINISSSTNIELQESGTAKRLDAAKELIIYRTIQELVHNIIKHAKASQGIVSISWQEDVLLVTVEDNGVGTPITKNTTGIGMDNIQKRITTLNGTIEISNLPGEGTSIYMEFPMD